MTTPISIGFDLKDNKPDPKDVRMPDSPRRVAAASSEPIRFAVENEEALLAKLKEREHPDVIRLFGRNYRLITREDSTAWKVGKGVIAVGGSLLLVPLISSEFRSWAYNSVQGQDPAIAGEAIAEGEEEAIERFGYNPDNQKVIDATLDGQDPDRYHPESVQAYVLKNWHRTRWSGAHKYLINAETSSVIIIPNGNVADMEKIHAHKEAYKVRNTESKDHGKPIQNSETLERLVRAYLVAHGTLVAQGVDFYTDIVIDFQNKQVRCYINPQFGVDLDSNDTGDLLKVEDDMWKEMLEFMNHSKTENKKSLAGEKEDAGPARRKNERDPVREARERREAERAGAPKTPQTPQEQIKAVVNRRIMANIAIAMGIDPTTDGGEQLYNSLERKLNLEAADFGLFNDQGVTDEETRKLIRPILEKGQSDLRTLLETAARRQQQPKPADAPKPAEAPKPHEPAKPDEKSGVRLDALD